MHSLICFFFFISRSFCSFSLLSHLISLLPHLISLHMFFLSLLFSIASFHLHF
ncbi:hypothetical protein J3Q64DRAFT_1721039, partial [Phycomyces blakesleeanus]